jgi:hypothetical protein
LLFEPAFEVGPAAVETCLEGLINAAEEASHK